MKEEKSRSGKLAYCWFWVWILVVSVLSSLLYFQIVEILGNVAKGIPFADEGLALVNLVKKDSWIYWGLVVLGWILFCWRIVKVVVLHAAPISWGMKISDGIHEENGRRGTFVTIEGSRTTSDDKETSTFWFGVILRSHPSSDKLVRSRLAFLILALPRGRSFMVSESRWMLRRLGHKDRRIILNKRRAEYFKSIESMPPDRFRREIVRSIDSIRKDISLNVHKIDGLVWIQPLDSSSGTIVDDFGYQLSYTRDGERYIVDPHSEDSESLSFASVLELREYAKSVLNPT